MTAPVPPVDLDQARQQGDVVLHEDRLYVYDPAGDPAYPWTVLTGAWDRWPESHIPAERPDLIAELRDLRAESEKRLDALIKVRAERDTLRAKVAAVEALAGRMQDDAERWVGPGPSAEDMRTAAIVRNLRRALRSGS